MSVCTEIKLTIEETEDDRADLATKGFVQSTGRLLQFAEFVLVSKKDNLYIPFSAMTDNTDGKEYGR